MSKVKDIILTSLAPVIWGTTFIVTEKLLPQGYPITTSVLRALPAGLLLIAITRSLPTGIWLWRSLVLGAFNFAIFLVLLFNTAYRLPGGIASTLGSIHPLITVVLSWLMLNQHLSFFSVLCGFFGLTGVAMMALNSTGELDPVGIFSAIASAASLSVGLVLTKKWAPPVSALAYTGWQMAAGGLLLLPVALLYEPALPSLTLNSISGFIYLGLIGGAVSYYLWFRGIVRLGPFIASSTGLLSPLTAVIIGVVFAGESLTFLQTAGMALVIASVWVASAIKS